MTRSLGLFILPLLGMTACSDPTMPMGTASSDGGATSGTDSVDGGESTAGTVDTTGVGSGDAGDTTGDDTAGSSDETGTETGESSETGTPTGDCGNGILDLGEMCDDGNAEDGDGCDADCTAPAGTLLWAIELGDDGDPERAGADVAVDDDGSVYVAGWASNPGERFGSLLQFSPEGDLVWEAQWGDVGGSAQATTVSVGPDGQPVVAGWQVYGPDNGQHRGWAAKYDPDGSELWSQTHTNATPDIDRWYGSDVDARNEIVLCGLAQFDGQNAAAWVRKLAVDGTEIWNREIVPAGHVAATANGCGFTPGGSVIAAGNTAPSAEPWLARLTVDGDDDWEQLGDAAFMGGTNDAVAVDAEGAPYTTGRYQVGGSEFVIPTRRHDPLGEVVWSSTRPLATFGQGGWDIAVHDDGSVTMVGTELGESETDDGLVVRYDENGNELWSEVFDDDESRFDRWRGVAVDRNSGAFYVTGTESDNGSNASLWLRKYAP